jgi:hypothetical protein
MPHHAHSIDRWDDATGSNLYEDLAGVNDLRLARATFAAAVKRWPRAKIALRNGMRIVEPTGGLETGPRECPPMRHSRPLHRISAWPGAALGGRSGR